MTFVERIDELQKQTGHGLLKGEINFDQVYARYVDGWGDLPDDSGVITPTDESHGPAGKPGPTFDHPRGGQAGYLTGTLTRVGPDIAQAWADSISEEQPLDALFIRQVESIQTEAADLAPREFWLLAGSGGTTVIDDDHTVYHRPAIIGRADEDILQEMKLSHDGDLEHAQVDDEGIHLRRRGSDLTPSVVEHFGGGTLGPASE